MFKRFLKWVVASITGFFAGGVKAVAADTRAVVARLRSQWAVSKELAAMDTAQIRVLLRAGLGHLSEQPGMADISNVIDYLVIGFVAIILILRFTPIFESEVSSENITNATTSSFVDILEWLFPTMALIGVIYLAIRFVKGRGRRGKGGY